MHEGDYTCVTYARNGQPDECRRTRCPVCSKEVYFVRHNDGAVWFDELGKPWEKHACFNVAMPLESAVKLTSDFIYLVRIRDVKPLLRENGYAVYYGKDRKASNVVDIITDFEIPASERHMLSGSDRLSLKSKWVYIDPERSRFVTLDGRTLTYRYHKRIGGWKK